MIEAESVRLVRICTTKHFTENSGSAPAVTVCTSSLNKDLVVTFKWDVYSTLT